MHIWGILLRIHFWGTLWIHFWENTCLRVQSPVALHFITLYNIAFPISSHPPLKTSIALHWSPPHLFHNPHPHLITHIRTSAAAASCWNCLSVTFHCISYEWQCIAFRHTSLHFIGVSQCIAFRHTSSRFHQMLQCHVKSYGWWDQVFL